MPKARSAALKTHMEGETTTMSKCLKIVLKRHQVIIDAVTQANPGAITTRWSHGLTTGDPIFIEFVRGMTELNGNVYNVIVTGLTTFTIDADTTAFTLYTSGGEAQRMLGYTSADKSFVFEKVTYLPTDSFTPAAAEQSADFSVSNSSGSGILSKDGVKVSDVQRGLYDNANVEFFLVNRLSLGDGRMWFGPGRGSIGEMRVERTGYETEFRGLEHKIGQQVNNVWSQTCRADLGNDLHPTNRCYVKLRPPLWLPTVEVDLVVAADIRIGSIVRPSTSNGFHFNCSVRGYTQLTEPTWPTTLGGTVTETPAIYAITAVNIADDKFTIAGNHVLEFQTGSNESLTVSGSTGNDGVYRIVAAVFSSPDTEIEVLQDVTDATVDGNLQNDTRPQWTAVLALSQDVAIDSIIGGEDKYRFRVISKEAADFYKFGSVVFLEGSNIGGRYEIKNDTFTAHAITVADTGAEKFTVAGDVSAYFAVGDVFSVIGSTGNNGNWTVASVTVIGGPSTEIEVDEDITDATADGDIVWAPRQIELFQDLPFEFLLGETVELTVGCDKLMETCKIKFNNLKNFRGEPYVPGTQVLLDSPFAKQ